MSCRYKSITQQDDNIKVDITTGEYCADLPAGKNIAMVEYYPALGKSVVMISNVHKRAKRCKNADELARHLLTPANKATRKVLSTTDKSATKANKPTVSVAESDSINVTDAVCDDVDNSIATVDYSTVDVETGELFSCRTSKSLHLTWVHVGKEIMASYKWDKCLFITCTMASRPSYDEMNHLATGFINRLKKQFKEEFQGIHKFLEPCEDGSWHVHYIACFHEIPKTFEKWAKKWWARKQGYENSMQVLIRKITSQDELEAIIRYLNPCSAKKEHRIPFYPKNCQCMRGYGDYAMPVTAICTFATAKKIVGNEMPTKRKNIRVTDADTNVELYYRIEYHFTTDIVSYRLERCYDMAADIHTNDTPPVQSPMPAPPEKCCWEDVKYTERNTALWQDYKYANTERMYG